MASAGIDELIDGTTTYSKAVSGGVLAQPGSRAQATRIAVQIVPTNASAAFSVELECAVNTVHGPTFEAIGQWDNNDDDLLATFPIALGCLYRFRHVSGGECRVLLTG